MQTYMEIFIYKKNIAEKMGHGDEEHFARIFKTHTPSFTICLGRDIHIYFSNSFVGKKYLWFKGYVVWREF